jgi:hypothetical protein
MRLTSPDGRGVGRADDRDREIVAGPAETELAAIDVGGELQDVGCIDRTDLGPISRRGNRYLRVHFVQAAWVVLIRPGSWERYGLKSWIESARKRLHCNVLVIALANKLARIAWSVLAHGRGFEANAMA